MRLPLVRRVGQEQFGQFVASAPIVLLKVGSRLGMKDFPRAIARHFASEYPDEVEVGVFDRTRLATPRWLVSRVRSAFAEPEALDRAPDGYYLFLDGRAASFHDGFYRGPASNGARMVGLVALLAGKGKIVHAAVNALDARAAQEIADLFDAAIAGTRVARAANPRIPAAPEAIDPYVALNVAPTATDAEVKAARNKAVKENHPDKVAHLSARLQDVAKHETLAANAAYEAIKKQRGLR